MFCRTARVAASCVVLTALAACNQDQARPDSGQVAAKVNGAEITVHQVEHVLSRQPTLAASEQGARIALDGLIEQELAAQAAMRDKLDQNPAFVQAMEAARREWLARAYHDKVVAQAAGPGADDIDRYFNANPALFAQRRVYILQDWVLAGSQDALTALQGRLRTAAPEQVTEILRASNLVRSSKLSARAAEDVPLGLLGKLGSLKDGQYAWLPAEGEAHVVVVLQSVAEPLTGPAAQRAITAFLQAEKRREAMRSSMKSLRDAATIERRGKFAQGAAAAASAAAAP